MRIPLSLSVLSLAAAVSTGVVSLPAAAEIYKWVDERGVTHYSDQPPPAGAQRLAIAGDRVSVYTPHPELRRAMEAERARAIEDIRTGRRSREIDNEWLARQYFAALRAQPADPCMGGACTAPAPLAYVPADGYAGRGRTPRILPQITLTPGTIAGHVTAGTGYMPGYSAVAPGSATRDAARYTAPPSGGSKR